MRGKMNPDPIARGKAAQVETYEGSDEMGMSPGIRGTGKVLTPGRRVPMVKKKGKKPVRASSKTRSFGGM